MNDEDLPRSPSGRVPRWVVDEAAGIPPADTTFRPAPATAPRRPRRRRAPGQGVAIGVVVLLVASWWALDSGAFTAVTGVGIDAGPARPPIGIGSVGQPLGQAPESDPGSSTSYAFIETNADGSPVGYDPCRPIRYVVNVADQPSGGASAIAQAVAAVSAATGLRFVREGDSTEEANTERSSYQPDRYGETWAPVLIDWTDPAGEPELEGDVAGLGGSQVWAEPGGPKVFVSGTVALDAPQLERAAKGKGGAARMRAVVQHELGHVVGLGHVDDKRQLMHERASRTDFGAGDRAGLAALGRLPCAPHV